MDDVDGSWSSKFEEFILVWSVVSEFLFCLEYSIGCVMSLLLLVEPIPEVAFAFIVTVYIYIYRCVFGFRMKFTI